MFKAEESSIPREYLCPISQEPMTDPVIAADGHTYERESITKWLQRKRKSPLNGSNLPHNRILDNLFAKKIIKDFQSRISHNSDVKSKLDQCIQEKEKTIKILLEKVDNLNMNQTKFTTSIILELKKEIQALKKHFNHLEQKNLKLEETNKNLMKENSDITLKNQIAEIDIQSMKPPTDKYISGYVDIKNLKKASSYQLNFFVLGILELRDGSIACWTREGIQVFKFDGEKLELCKSFPFISLDYTYPIEHNKNIVFKSSEQEILIYDMDFKKLQSLKIDSYFASFGISPDCIDSLCSISDNSFAIGSKFGMIEIFSRNPNTQQYEESNKFKNHQRSIFGLLYLPKQNYLISGSDDLTINVYSLSEAKSIKKLEGSNCHNSPVSSLLYLDEATFASASNRDIKVWSIKQDIECIKTINAHKGHPNNYIILHSLGNDYMVSYKYNEKEFKIWDKKNYECLGTYKENSGIQVQFFTKNNLTITATKNIKLNLWKSSQ